MWDSFESIYLAAAKDEDCEVSLVPVPYYERCPNGALGGFHFENIPDFPTISYEKYDIEKEHPDIVYYHNPYDELNRVTCVDPRFHSKSLRKNATMLVYVDYGMPIWCYRDTGPYSFFLSGWFEADFYPVYSEQMAINHLTEMKRVNPELKTEIVGLGSPKFDKVINERREDFKLPNKWKRILNRKKSILFNASLGALLKNTPGYMIRLKKILNIFYELRDEITLWWRPHPLFIETLSSMRPDMLQMYKSLIKEYKRSGWGIYDDTANLHRAITCSDGYWGDESSLVYLYAATGKPMTILGDPFDKKWFTEGAKDFTRTLDWRINNMRQAKGANVNNENVCVWWGNFWVGEDLEKFLRLFIDFVVHEEDFPAAKTCRELQIKLFRESVSNSDGTAGQHIHEYAKNKLLRGDFKR